MTRAASQGSWSVLLLVLHQLRESPGRLRRYSLDARPQLTCNLLSTPWWLRLSWTGMVWALAGCQEVVFPLLALVEARFFGLIGWTCRGDVAWPMGSPIGNSNRASVHRFAACESEHLSRRTVARRCASLSTTIGPIETIGQSLPTTRGIELDCLLLPTTHYQSIRDSATTGSAQWKSRTNCPELKCRLPTNFDT